MQKNLTQTTKKTTNHKIKTYTDTKSISNNLGAFGVCKDDFKNIFFQGIVAFRRHLAPTPQDLRVKCRSRVELDFGPLKGELFKIIQNTINKNQKNFNLIN